MRPVLGPHARTDRPQNTRVTEPWLPAPEDGRPGEGQRLTPDGPHNGGRPPPPGTAPPPPPRHAAPTGHASQGDSAGPPHPHTRAHSTWVADPNSPPSGRAVGGGTAPDFRRPSKWWKALPPGTPFRHPHSKQRRPARAHAVRPVLGPKSPHRPHPGHTDRGTLAARSRGRAAGGGTAPDTRRPSQRWRAPSSGTPFRHLHSEQRRPARAHAVGPGLGPQARTDRPQNTRVTEPWLPAPEDGRPGEGQRLTPDGPHNGGRPPPPGTAPPPPPRHAASTRHASQGDSAGPPHPHTRAHSTWVADPNSPPSGRAVGGGTAPDIRRPSQWWKAPPPRTPFRHPHSEQRRRARAHAVGLVLGPRARTDRTRDTRVAEPRLPAPEEGRPGEGQRLTADAPRNGGRPDPPGTAPHQPRSTQPPQGMQAQGTVLGPHTHTPVPTARGWRAQQPAQWAGSRGGDSA